MPARVIHTPAAATVIRRLKDRHGPLVFHQSGGCCDGSVPMCYPQGEFLTGAHDLLLGFVEECPVFIASVLFDYWAGSQLILDVSQGRSGGFSLEVADGVRFVARSRLFTDAEMVEVDAAGPPAAGAHAVAATMASR